MSCSVELSMNFFFFLLPPGQVSKEEIHEIIYNNTAIM